MSPKVIRRVSARLLGLALSLASASCAHTLSEQPNTPEVSQPVQHTNDPISQTVDVAVDSKGDVAVKQNDRKKAIGAVPPPTEPIANPLDPTAPPPATVTQPQTINQP